MTEVRDELGVLIRQAIRGRRLVVFVDDLERCSPARAIEACEVANQLLSHDGVVTVFIADMHLIASSAEEQYGAGGAITNAGRRYLEKIVQFQLTLPPPRADDMERLLVGEAPPGAPSDLLEAAAAESSGATGAGTGLVPALTRAYVQPVREAFWAAIPAALVAGWVGFRAWLAAYEFAPSGDAEGAGFFAIPGHADSIEIAMSSIVGLGAAHFGSSIAVLCVTTFRRARSKRRRHRIKERVDALIAESAQHELEEKVVRTFDDEDDRETALRILRSYLVDEAVELHGVEDEILRYPPRLPRGAKRMLNHARLLTQIARSRGLFGGEPPLTPGHLGEWIVLTERWPALARQIESEPDRLRQLEAAAALSAEALAANLGEGCPEDVETLQKLLTHEPHLGDVVTRLVHFEPAKAAVA